MKIVVFGANGKVGTKVVKAALSQNHSVIAFVRGKHDLPSHENLSIQQGDIYDKESVTQVVARGDVVISALGSWGTPKKDILTKGMEHIIPAMKEAGITRIVSLTGADASAPGDTSSFLHRISRTMLGVVAGKILQDGERHIALLETSALDWTVLRSPVMNEMGQTSYTLDTTRPTPWSTIHRQAVAEALVTLATTDAYIKSAPFLHR